MLPQSFFDRLLASERMRFGAARVERRKVFRVPHRRPARIFTVCGGVLLDNHKGTVRDISRSGVGVLTDAKVTISKDWLLCVGPHLCTEPASAVIRCRTARTVAAGSTNNLLGAKFVSILVPGQFIKSGLVVSDLEWIAVDGADITDPLIKIIEESEAA
jgi:hypothetical protein